MFVTLMKSKIHRARVTEANLNYVGSVTIDSKLMTAANIFPNEKVQIVNVNNGKRFETYVIEGEKGSGMICLNGAAARLAHPDDIVIIITYAQFENSEAASFKPTVVVVDAQNEIVEISGTEIHGDKK